MKNGIKTLAMWLIIGVIFVVLVSAVLDNSESKMTYSELISAMEAGNVTSIEINSDGNKAFVELKGQTIEKEVNIPNLESFMNYANEGLVAGNFKLTEKSESVLVTILSLLSPFGIAIIFLLFWFLLMNPANQGGNKTMSFGKSKARILNGAEKAKVTFKDVAGVDEEKEELEEIVEFLKTPKKFTDMGARIPKGVLLVGQPGTGKTLLAARRNLEVIGMKEIEDAMVKVTMGPEKKSRVRSQKENKLVAYHEAGHAVVSHYLETQDPVHQISIVPRGMAGGYTMYRPTEDKSFMSKTEMEENIVSLLGGRVAEKLILDDISTGASNDIERATKIARSMVTKYGMSDRIGAMMLGSSQEEVFLGRDFAQGKEYSEETASLVDTETKRIIDKAYEQAIDILNTHIDKLHAVAKVLLEKEKIEGEEFDEIFAEEN